jgi:transposase
MTSVIIDREIGNWHRFNNRRQIASYTGLCPGEYSSGHTRLQSCVTKHGNPRLRAALVELAWRMVRFQPRYRPSAKKPSSLWPANWQWICGVCAPAGSHNSNWD